MEILVFFLENLFFPLLVSLIYKYIENYLDDKKENK